MIGGSFWEASRGFAGIREAREWGQAQKSQIWLPEFGNVAGPKPV